MSAQDSDDDGPGQREVAHRVFAAEYDDATVSYQEGDRERAPTYVVTPSGAKANRLFLVGVLTEVEQVNEQMLRARVVDPTGAFVVYAGQYQPDARAVFDRTAPPAFLAVAGKARTFQPEDSDQVYSSVRPESVSVVDGDVRDRWVVETARATLARVGGMATALRQGEPGAPTDGVALALEHYDTTPGYLAALRDLATETAEVVAGDREEVTSLALDPDEDRPADLAALAALADLGPTESATDAGTTTETAAAETEATDAESGPAGTETGADTTTTPDAEPEATVDAEPEGSDATTEAADEIEEIAASESVESMGTDDLEVGGDVGETSTSDDDLDGLGDFDGGVDDVGDFESGDAGASETTTDSGVADEELYEMDEEERERIESEYGTEFSTGTEVDEPGEAGIDAPEPDSESTPAEAGDDELEATTAEDTEPDTEDAEPEPADDAETADESDPEVDVDEVLLEQMRELDEGEGADREALLAAVVEATGADVGAVEDAIQDALMSGQCYEPAEDRLKPI